MDSNNKRCNPYSNMKPAFAYHKMIFDNDQPIDYVFLEVNDAFENIIGLKKNKIIGKKVTQVIPTIKQDSTDWISIYGKVVVTRQPIKFENYSSSLKKWFQVLAYSPKENHFVTTFQDITDQKNIEKKILDLSKFPSENPNIVIRVNSKGSILYMNPASQFLLTEWNTSAGKKLPRRLKKLVHGAFSSKKKIEFEAKYKEQTFLFSIVPVVDEKYLNIYGTEISALKKNEEKFREIQQDLSRAQSVAKTGSWRLDVKNNVLSWSDENYKIFGVKKGTPLTYETFLSIVHPDDRKYVDKKWNSGLEERVYDIEHRLVVDGKIKWVREKAEIELDKDGNVRGGFGTTQDITDTVKLREKLEFYSKNLEKLVKIKTKELKDAEKLITIGQTAGMVGHDIRNPLQSIDGAIYLAKIELESLQCSENSKRELFDVLNLIDEQIHYIDHIVADLQDFAKTPVPQREESNIQDLIMESLQTVKWPRNIEIVTCFDEKLKTIEIDPILLKRVTSNLLLNAYQAMPNGGKLTITVFCDNDDELKIRIKDTGIGIPENDKSKIFTPLFTTKSKGQGFGLAVCKKLIEAQEGKITFESKQDMGTTFTVQFPIR